MKKATVIIPNYNGLHFLKPCLKALDSQTDKDFEVCVVDNGSDDGSTEFLEKEYPSVRMIAFSENTGFCKAVNAGVKASETPYVILLNNDTVPDKDFVRELIKGLDDNADVFSCASCMLTKQDETILDGAGDLYSALGWAFARGKDKKAADYEKQADIFSACAGAAIYRTEVFKSLGMLDEQHFAYLEDMDLGWRARLHGWRSIYIPSAKVVHLGSGTTGSRHNDFKVRLSARNNIYMIRKNMPRWQQILNAPLLFAGRTIKILYFKRKGLDGAYKEGYEEGKRMEPPAAIKEAARASAGAVWKIQLELWTNVFKRSF